MNTATNTPPIQATTKREWVDPAQHPGDWYEIRATFHRLLTDDQVWEASGAIGYALRQAIRGENLSEPVKIKRGGKGTGKTIVRYSYDSTKTWSDDPDVAEAFELATRYIAEGSPVRTTDRAGAGTRGTRLVTGIGPVGVRFEVR